MDILIAKISENLAYIDKASISTKFGCERKNLEYTIGRTLVKFGAKKFFNIEDFVIDESDKKPVIKDNLFEFSISHSNDIVAVGFSKEKIGIDVEKIVPRNYKKLALRMGFNCSNLQDFYEQWTQYEAKFKSGMMPVKSLKFEDYVFSVSAINFDEINLYRISIQNNKFIPIFTVIP